MARIIVGVFLILHGFVHLLYFGQSQQIFELQPGMIWPEGSWFLTNLVGGENTRLIASVSLVLAAIVFIFSGAGLFFRQTWWRILFVIAIAFSSLVYLLLWDGKMEQLPNQGLVGVLINIALAVFILVLNWPTLEP